MNKKRESLTYETLRSIYNTKFDTKYLTQDEFELLMRHRGDNKDRLVGSFMAMVYKQVDKMHKSYKSIDKVDLTQEGIIAVVKAFDKIDLSFTVAMAAAYVSKTISHALLDYVIKDKLVSQPKGSLYTVEHRIDIDIAEKVAVPHMGSDWTKGLLDYSTLDFIDKEEVDYILSTLTTIQRKVVISNMIEGYTLEEIADKISLSLSSIEKAKAQGLTKFKEIYLKEIK